MYRLSVSPHIHSKASVSRIMWTFIVALMPAMAASIWFFGPRALYLEIISVATAVITELLTGLLLKKRITLSDGSAVITGLLVAFNMPVSVPYYVPIVGSFFGIAIVKQLFGGLGYNIFNPALAARVFVMFAWLPEMTTWNAPLTTSGFSKLAGFNFSIDTITTATPLAIAKMKGMAGLLTEFGSKMGMYKDLFLGKCPGCIGETSALALLLGAGLLLLTKIIRWPIPLSYLATVVLICLLSGNDPIFHLLSGGLILGAFFMATDYVTSPMTPKGMILFGVGCGLVTMVLRLKGGLPEGVSFSILFMNALAPLIDRYFKNPVLGVKT
ncbi:MAG: RnfABCDGE type electron transport complex subunit D [Spirochaetes bacterium]|nr:RnfABCDGE type electron transport complex subunit D [Spirochaetota bacterium]